MARDKQGTDIPHKDLTHTGPGDRATDHTHEKNNHSLGSADSLGSILLALYERHDDIERRHSGSHVGQKEATRLVAA